MTTKLRTSVERSIPTGHAGTQHEGGGTAWVRVSATAGLVFFGLVVGFGNLLGGMPAADASSEDVVTFLEDHHEAARLAAVLYGWSMAAALLFLCGLFGALTRAEGGRPRLAVAAVAGDVLAAAASVTGALVLGVAANRYPDLGPSGTRTMWTMFLMSLGGTLAGHVLMIGTTAAVTLRTGLFARWFGVASAVLALASVVGAMTIGYPVVGVQVVAGVTVVLNSVWILLVSVFLWRRPQTAIG